MSKPWVCLTTAGLTVDDVHRVAVEGAQVEIAEEVLQIVREGRAVVERALDGDTPVYGLNTGLGHLRNQRVSRETLIAYQERIIRSHAAGVGPPLPDADVRAMILARIAGMARGGSGAHPGAFETLVAMLNAGVHPIVPEVGSVGAADLMHMAAMALVVIGAGDARACQRLSSGKQLAV